MPGEAETVMIRLAIPTRSVPKPFDQTAPVAVGEVDDVSAQLGPLLSLAMAHSYCVDEADEV